jgi:hypothetical protein
MPLRDHFHKPLSDQTPWESIHAGWPMEIVRQLFGRLPKHYRATPSRKLSGGFEIDIAYLRSATFDGGDDTAEDGWNGTATATLTKLKPSVSVSADLTKPDEVEILVYDGAGELVAAVELVSPANKDRPASREEFVAKAAGLLHRGVCVTIVDIVTSHHFNLYADLLAHFAAADPTLGDPPPATYAATLRGRGREKQIDCWSHSLAVGLPLPTLPIWLAPDLAVGLPLEAGYEETCRLLRVA